MLLSLPSPFKSIPGGRGKSINPQEGEMCRNYGRGHMVLPQGTLTFSKTFKSKFSMRQWEACKLKSQHDLSPAWQSGFSLAAVRSCPDSN